MSRSLASIQEIVSIEPIPDADKIEKATVLGWEVVVKKDEFKKGDLVVYIEIDSIVPELPEFEFLRERKFRVRTIKLRKQVSQGLILGLDILPSRKWKIGDDVTNIIGIKKYDPQADLEAKMAEEIEKRAKNKLEKFLFKNKWYKKFFMPAKQGFPSFIKKTDEDRIQLFPDICQKYKDNSFVVTEKIDGQSATYALIRNKKRFLWFGDKYIFIVCSRNLMLKESANNKYWQVAKKYNIKNVLESIIGNFDDYIVVQGENVGEGIQGNKYGFSDVRFFAFNLITPSGKIDSVVAKWILHEKLDFVPILEEDFYLLENIPKMVEFSQGKSVLADIPREGVVVRNYNKNISFKVINPEFLLKYGE